MLQFLIIVLILIKNNQIFRHNERSFETTTQLLKLYFNKTKILLYAANEDTF